MQKFDVKFTNFTKAIRRLDEAVSALRGSPVNSLYQDAVIQRFEFTFELCWKTLQAYMQEQGILDINSPRSALREAYSMKLIDKEDVWIELLTDRNMTSHVYDENTAAEISKRICDIYLQFFKQVYNALHTSGRTGK